MLQGRVKIGCPQWTSTGSPRSTSNAATGWTLGSLGW